MKRFLLAVLAAFTLTAAYTDVKAQGSIQQVSVQLHFLKCLAANTGYNGCLDSVITSHSSARADTTAAIDMASMLPFPFGGGSTNLADSTFLFRLAIFPAPNGGGLGVTTGLDSLQWKHQFSMDGVNWSLDDPPGFLGFTPVSKTASRAYSLSPRGLVSSNITTAMLIPPGVRFIRFIIRLGAGFNGAATGTVTFYTNDSGLKR